MRHLGFFLLLTITAGAGAAVYFTGQLDLSGFKTPLSRLLLVLCVVTAFNLITAFGTWGLQRSLKKRTKAELKQITSVYKYVLMIILIFVIAGLLYGIIGPAITSIGLLAAGITVALQRVILNVAGWFTIIVKRPYRIGDRVEIGPIGGFIHEISLMHTHLSLVVGDEHTGKAAYVPNEQALTQSIVNYTRGTAMVWAEVKARVPGAADIRKAEKLLIGCANEVVGKQMEEAAKKWKTELTPEVRVRMDYTGTNEFYIEMVLRYMCNASDVQQVRTAVTKKIIEAFRKQQMGGKK